MKLRRPLHRQTLWIGFIAVLVPLLILLGLQRLRPVALPKNAGPIHWCARSEIGSPTACSSIAGRRRSSA